MASRDPEKAADAAVRLRVGPVERARDEPISKPRNRLNVFLAVSLLGLLALVWLRPERQVLVMPISNKPVLPTKSLVKHQESSTTSAPAATGTVLECFQVAQPVLTPDGASYQSTAEDGSTMMTGVAATSSSDSCSVLLMDHIFANSYGMPFIGNYTPPSCEFNRVVMNFTVVGAGRQFDRLALMYLGDTEVWRTSTAEPSNPPGIRWTYMKDMTEFMSLWKSPQTLIFDLGNVVDDTYTASYNATLTATFFTSAAETDTASPADLIIPISARKSASNAVSAFVLPTDNATNVISFPRNANRAVFTVSANGQASEEFWWSNVLQSDVATFNKTAGTFTGWSPFREVQVLIDGQLAGAWWPYPVIFTGGVVPSLHRPIVGLDAFNLEEHEIDITPWLPSLCDGAQHNFTILVAGLDDDGTSSAKLTQTVNSNWVVTGKVFVWLDDENSVTTGTTPSIEFSDPTITFSRTLGQNSTGFNETLTFNLAVDRVISVKSTVNSQSKSGEASWSQTLSYTNNVNATAFGFDQINDFLTTGLDTATNPSASYKTNYGYPLYCDSTYVVEPTQGNITISAHLIQGLNLEIDGSSVFPTGLEAFAAVPRTQHAAFTGSLLNTSRDSTAAFTQTADGKTSTGYGSSNQVFHFGGFTGAGSLGDTPDVELYFRNVTAINGTVMYNSERVAATNAKGFNLAPGTEDTSSGSHAVFAQSQGLGTGPRAFMWTVGGGNDIQTAG